MRLLRDFVVLPILRMKSIQRRMFGKLSQLHVHYRKSSLSHQEVKQGSHLKAGDRAPDVAFESCDSHKRITLFELLKGVRPVVLTGSDVPILEPLRALELEAHRILRKSDRPTETSTGQWIDVHGDFEELYGMHGNFLCLIRPDGHIGLIQNPVDRDSLEKYLGRICDPQKVEQVFTAGKNPPVL